MGADFSLPWGCSKAHLSPFLHCPLRKNRQSSTFLPPSMILLFLLPFDHCNKYQMEATGSKRLDFDYREYKENAEGLPRGTQIGEYTVQQEIGKGAFGKIYFAKNKKKEDFAIKLMDLEKIRQEANPKVKDIRWRLVQNQPTLMMQCNSPNVLRCYDIFQNESLKVLVLEYCNGRTLQEYLDKKIKIKEEQAVRILRQIISGIAQLHKHKIIHRDLKADNIMEHEGQYKIIDLGFSKKLEIAQELDEIKGTILGTVTTMAPEVLSKLSYGLKADIWSIGVIFFQMVFGVLLYDSVSARQRLKEIEEKRYFSPDKPLTFNGITISVDANNFLYRALEVNTEKRMGWRELLQHPLIRKKQQQPIGDRFLVENRLEMPQVNLDLEIKPTKGESIKEEDKNAQKQVQVDLKVADNKVQNVKEAPKEKKELPKEEEKKKNGFKLDYKNKDKGEEPPRQRWKREPEPFNEEPKQRWQLEADFANVKKEVPLIKPKIEEPRPKQEWKKLQDSPTYKWVKLAHLECLKTELIYNQIIIPIQREKLLDLNDREAVQFMFLIAARCFQNVSPLRLKVQAQKNKVNPIVKNLDQQVKGLYQKTMEKFEYYSQQLTKIQNGLFQMFLDFFRKRFLKKDYDEKSKYTSGIELPQEERTMTYGDYGKIEQIKYTYNSFISNILKKVAEKKTQIAEKVVGYLRYYDKIGLVTLEELGNDSFGEYVRRIVI